MHHPRDMITHTTAFVTPVVEHLLEREIAQCPPIEAMKVDFCLLRVLVLVAMNISNFLICFCSFDLSCPILEKDNFMKNMYIVLS